MDREIARLAESQHGVFSRAQILELGGSERMISARLSSGRWEQVLPGVYAIAGAPRSWLGTTKAAELWSWPDGAISHRTSGRLLGFEGLRKVPLEVSCLRGIRYFRELVLDRVPGEKVAGSVLATDFLRWLRKQGFEKPVAEHRVFLGPGWIFDLDFAYPARKMGFEVDGYRPHRGRQAQDRDTERENLLKAHGWLIVRVTSTMLRRKQDELRFTIEQALRQRP